jgi:hypothetical protein
MVMASGMAFSHRHTNNPYDEAPQALRKKIRKFVHTGA